MDSNYLTSGNYYALAFDPDAEQFLTLKSSGISISMKTGRVTIPEGLSLDDASREFWDAVQIVFPGRVPKVV